MSSGTSVTTDSPTYNFCSAITTTSNDSNSPTVAATHSSFPQTGLRSPKMTTYYCYNENGDLRSASTLDSVTHSYPEHPYLRYYLEHGDTVGAYLTQRAMMFPTCAAAEFYSHGSRGSQVAYKQQPVAYHATTFADLRHESDEQAGQCGSRRSCKAHQFALHVSRPGRYSPPPQPARSVAPHRSWA
jgi:hypothetical protein